MGPLQLFTAGGFISPAPFLNPTVLGPHTPFGFFAYGAQLKGSIGNWDVLADVTGSTGLAFDAPGQFERIEVSGRLIRTFSDDLWLAAGMQFSPDFRRFSLDGSYQPHPKVNLSGALYYVDEDDDGDDLGGYGLLTYKPISWLELHSQYDQLGRDRIWTNGVRLLTDKERLSFTVDYESHMFGERSSPDNRLLMRLQVRF